MSVLYSECGWLPFGWGKKAADVSTICDGATTVFDGKHCVAKTLDHSICDPATTEFRGGKCVSKIFDDSICDPDTTEFTGGRCVSNVTGEAFCDPATTSFEVDKCVSSVAGDTFCDPATTSFEVDKCVSIPRCPLYSRMHFDKVDVPFLGEQCVLSQLERSPNCDGGNFRLDEEGKHCIYASDDCQDELRSTKVVDSCAAAHHDERNGLKYVFSNPKSCEFLYESHPTGTGLRRCTFDAWASDSNGVTCKSGNAPVCVMEHTSTCTEHDEATLQNVLNEMNDPDFLPQLCCEPSSGQAGTEQCQKISNFLDCACA